MISFNNLHDSRWYGTLVVALVNRVVSQKNEVLDNHHNRNVHQADNTEDAVRGGKKEKGNYTVSK